MALTQNTKIQSLKSGEMEHFFFEWKETKQQKSSRVLCRNSEALFISLHFILLRWQKGTESMLRSTTINQSWSLKWEGNGTVREEKGDLETKKERLGININSKRSLVVTICTPIMKETVFSCNISTKSLQTIKKKPLVFPSLPYLEQCSSRW